MVAAVLGRTFGGGALAGFLANADFGASSSTKAFGGGVNGGTDFLWILGTIAFGGGK